MDGILIVNKEQNWTSNDVVQKVKRITGEKVGHTGTLDPLATGVLPLLIGKGTLLSKYLVNHDKTYIAKVKLGIKTDTADLEGEAIKKVDVDDSVFDEKNIREVLKSFEGKQKQTPPMYSAIKIKGKKLYEYARSGKNVDVPARNIEIYEMELIDFDRNENEIEFKVSCSKGTYIRSLCEDIAKKLGNIGTMSNLNRIRVGEFKIEDSITINEAQEIDLNKKIITIENFFENKDKIELSNRDLKLFLNGVKLTRKEDEDIYRIYCNNSFIGIGVVSKEYLKREIVV